MSDPLTKSPIQQSVSDYYGTTLTQSADLATDACCTLEAPPEHLKAIISDIHPDTRNRYYGCGLIAPLALDGMRVLDLGCGAGYDAFVLARLVGEHGHVVGVDMTEEQLAAARDKQDWHREKFGYATANTTFLHGDIEKLDRLDLAPQSFDVIISNCVINLCENKAAIFQAAFDLLKPGGEFYFSDVYADRRLPDAARAHPKAHGECLAGALYWNDFLTIAAQAGFADPRLVTARPLAINDRELQDFLSPAQFHSATYRLFRIDGLESACEDYGQAVVYRGGVAHAEKTYTLDDHHVIEQGKVFPVCGNTFRMLYDSRFAPYFEFIGDFSTHYGIFPGCGTVSPFADLSEEAGQSGGCC